MNENHEDLNHQLTQLALGTLSASARLHLVQRAANDAQLALDIKFALRLRDESAALTCDWVQTASRPSAAGVSNWRRSLAGVTASVAIAAAVMLVPAQRQTADDTSMVAFNELPTTSDVILGAGSFEANGDSIGQGSFE